MYIVRWPCRYGGAIATLACVDKGGGFRLWVGFGRVTQKAST